MRRNCVKLHGIQAIEALRYLLPSRLNSNHKPRKLPVTRSTQIDDLIAKFIGKNLNSLNSIELRELDLDQIGTKGRTPLMAAAFEGALWAVQTLVEAGASPGKAGFANLTPLHEAASVDQVEVARYLLSVGANINAITVDGVTPLMCAAAGGSLNCVKLLLDKNADIDIRDRTGLTASDIASEKGEDLAASLIDSSPQKASND